jgi:integrase/recombinase XerD
LFFKEEDIAHSGRRSEVFRPSVKRKVIENNNSRYILVDEEGFPVIPVVKYLKYLDTTGKSRNKLKTYCYALKQYFVFLQEKRKG